MHLASIERRLKDVAARLEARAAPVREHYGAMGPAGLYALAAQHRAAAEVAVSRADYEVQLSAADAAEALADDLLAVRRR
jgi:hypothetical protein